MRIAPSLVVVAFAAAARWPAPFVLDFDPRPLPPAWPALLTKGDAAPPDCGDRARRTVFVAGSYGRLNNRLQTFANVLLLAALHPDKPAVALPDALVEVAPEDAYDYPAIAAALASWVCVARPGVTPGGGVLHVAAKDAFFMGRTALLGYRAAPRLADLRGEVLAQILLRPRPAVRAAVAAFSARHNLTNGYVAVHLRSLEGWCDAAVPAGSFLEDAQRLRTEDLARGPGRRHGHPLEAKDLCSMSNAYVDGALRRDRVPPHWPLVLVTDGQQPRRAAQMTRRYKAASYEGPHAAHVDLLLLARSSYLLANPVSTYSVNAHLVRKASGASPESTTLDWDLPPPGLREPVGDGPAGHTGRTPPGNALKRKRATARARARAARLPRSNG